MAGAAALFLQTVSCSKKGSDPTTTNPNPNPTTQLTVTEKLLVGDWVLTKGVSHHTDSYGANDSANRLDDCQTDDVYTFKNDKTYVVSDGAKTCASQSSYNYPNDWTIEDDSTLTGFISLQATLRDEYPKIITINNSILQLKYEESYSASGVYWTDDVYIYTFQRK